MQLPNSQKNISKTPPFYTQHDNTGDQDGAQRHD